MKWGSKQAVKQQLDPPPTRARPAQHLSKALVALPLRQGTTAEALP